MLNEWKGDRSREVKWGNSIIVVTPGDPCGGNCHKRSTKNGEGCQGNNSKKHIISNW